MSDGYRFDENYTHTTYFFEDFAFLFAFSFSCWIFLAAALTSTMPPAFSFRKSFWTT